MSNESLKFLFARSIAVIWACTTHSYKTTDYTRSIRSLSCPLRTKMLDISFESFRDKLLPGQEEQWKILIKGKNADKVAAEMVAHCTMNRWMSFVSITGMQASLIHNTQDCNGSSINGFNQRELTIYDNSWNTGTARSPESIDFDSFNWFGYSFYEYFGTRRWRVESQVSVACDDQQGPRWRSQNTSYRNGRCGGIGCRRG